MKSKVERKEKQEQLYWNEVLGPYAEKLATLLINNNGSYQDRENEAIKIGADAWRMGGLKCMRKLYSMTIDIYKQKHQGAGVTGTGAIDYISNWWDGIGSWRSMTVV
ncbi:MAG: hypothetical protein ACYTBV_18015 [Planctomycetota bacterium]